jgi:hypothetical protein
MKPVTFDDITIEACHINDKSGPNAADIFLQKCVSEHLISSAQAKIINNMIFKINNDLSILE